MKKQGTIIEVNGEWVLVNNDKIKEDDISFIGDTILTAIDTCLVNALNALKNGKIIASERQRGFLHLLSRKQIEEQINGWDVEKLACAFIDDGGHYLEDDEIAAKYKNGFIAGFNKHAELNNEKRFTLEDMLRVFKECKTILDFELLTKSLSSHTQYAVEWEEEAVAVATSFNTIKGAIYLQGSHELRPKLTDGYLYVKIIK